MQPRLEVVGQRTGPSTRIPQRPSTTLGIAASISTSAPTTPPTPRGASSLRKRAIAIASGAAISSAISERDRGAVDERQRAEDVLVRVPRAPVTNARPNSWNARPARRRRPSRRSRPSRRPRPAPRERDHAAERGRRASRGGDGREPQTARRRERRSRAATVTRTSAVALGASPDRYQITTPFQPTPPRRRATLRADRCAG